LAKQMPLKGNSEVTEQPKFALGARLELIVKTQPNRKHWYAYDVQLDGVTIVADSRDPEHDAARALLARGITGTATVFDGGKARTVIPDIEKAAGYCTKEGPLRFAKLSLPERASRPKNLPPIVSHPRHWRLHEQRIWKLMRSRRG
jgi:hypothetical protein